ncbi:unnamed protein product [Closterium sp. NIES-54]
MDVCGPARVSGQDRERYFLLVVDDYTRYTTRFRQDLPILRLHSDRGGGFSSNLLRYFCRGEGILQSFTLPASPQQNEIAERRIGLVMEVARTSMIHADAPHFLWPFAVRYAVHQLNLWPRVSLPETSPTLCWAGKVCDASVFRGPTPSGVSQVDPLTKTVPVEVAVDPGAARGAASGGAEPASAEPGGAEPARVEPGGAESEGAEYGDAETGGVEPGGTEPEGAEPGGADSEGAESGGAAPRGTASAGGPAGAGGPAAGGTGAGGAGATSPGCAGVSNGDGGNGAEDPGAGGAGAGGAGAGGTDVGGTVLQTSSLPPPDSVLCQQDSPLPAPSPYAEQTDSPSVRREPASRPASPVCAVRTCRRVPRPRPPSVPGTHVMALRPSSVPLRSPPASSLPGVPGPASDLAHAASPTVPHLLATVITDPLFESTAASALVAELVDFAAACRLNYATSLVADSESDCPPSVGGECALGTDVLEDRQEEFECLTAAVPHLVAMRCLPLRETRMHQTSRPRALTQR